MLVGLAWLLLLSALAWFRVPEPPTPHVGQVPVPTLLSLGGLLLYAVLNLVRRRFLAVGARRHHTRVLGQLEDAVADAASERALAPLRAEVDAHAQMATALRRAAGRPA